MKRRIVAVAAWFLGLALIGGVAAAAISLRSAPESPQNESPHTSTTEIEQGTLEGSTSASGSLGYGTPRDLDPTLAGVLTWAPNPGANVGLGQPLYSVNNDRVYLMFGATPAWREFKTGMPSGPDVQQLEESLQALGFFGDTPDEVFDWVTRESIREWQDATGQKRTGEIALGEVVFEAGSVRVANVPNPIGSAAAPGTPVLTITDPAQQVQVDLSLSDQRLAVVGATVEIELPGGTTTQGTVQSVGIPTERKDDQSGEKKTVIPVAISLDDPSAAGDLQEASVTVQFPSERREDVLSVPVGALLSLPDGTFGVERVAADGTTSRVPVETGLFAGGRVEISGDGLKAGDTVTVPDA